MEQNVESITQTIIDTINTIFSSIFSSIDNSMYDTLNDLAFLSSDILENSFFKISLILQIILIFC